jgi:hypothetical protein
MTARGRSEPVDSRIEKQKHAFSNQAALMVGADIRFNPVALQR